jgi:hypothetical protein
MNARLPRLVFAGVLISCAALYIISVPTMPEGIATLFAGDGLAKGYMTKGFYLPYVLVFGLGLPLLLAFMISVLPGMLNGSRATRSTDSELVSDEGKLAVVTPFGWWYASLTAVFSASMHRLVVKANQLDPPQLANTPFLILLFGFLAVTFIWVAVVIVRVRRETR